MSVVSSCEILTHVLSGMNEILYSIFTPQENNPTKSVFYEKLKESHFNVLLHLTDVTFVIYYSNHVAVESLRFPFCFCEEHCTRASLVLHFLQKFVS